MEAFDVLRIAGVEACMKTDVQQAEIAQSELQEVARLQEEETEWRESRQEELDQIKKRKDRRRGVFRNSVDEAENVEDGDAEIAEEQEDALDPEERRRQFDEYRRRTGLTVNADEDFDGFIARDSEILRKRLSTPMEREEEEEAEMVAVRM